MLFARYRLTPALQSNLDRLGFHRPTDIQFRAIPPILEGNDLLAIAQTGTGKTLAFAVPTIQRLSTSPRPQAPYSPRAMILVPTHELALQIYKVFQSLAQGTGLRCGVIIGGSPVREQAARLDRRLDILIATPGRMNDLARNRYVLLSSVRHLILDEADKMLEMGFHEDISHLLAHIPRRRQTLFFSATISPAIKKLAYKLVYNPIRIEIAPEDPVSKNIDHSLLQVEMDDKRFFLERLSRQNPTAKILAFVRTKVRAERVHAAMGRVGILAILLHGDLGREARAQAIADFTAGTTRLMIATDVSARGLDIPSITHVVNYDLPTDPETYIHRIGRTGRGKQRGIAVSFCAPEEQPLRQAIEQLLGHFIQEIRLEEEDYQDTLDFSRASETDWETLIEREEARVSQTKGRRGKRKK